MTQRERAALIRLDEEKTLAQVGNNRKERRAYWRQNLTKAGRRFLRGPRT